MLKFAPTQSNEYIRA